MTTRDAVYLAACAAALHAPTAALGETAAEGLDALRSGYEAAALPKLEEAVRILRKEADGPDPRGEIHYHLARAIEGIATYHANGGRSGEAARWLDEAMVEARIALDRDDRSSAFHTLLGDLYGQRAAVGGLMDKMRAGKLAAVAYRRALELDPRNALAHVGVGIGKLETPAMFGGSVAEALAGFRTAQQLDPTCEEAWIWEGIALRRRGSIADARRAFTKALEVNPRNDQARREMASLEEDFQ